MRRRRGGLHAWIAVAVCGLLLSACGGGGGEAEAVPQSPGVGRVAILLTDAPTEVFDAINVTITRVYLLSGDARVLALDGGADGVTRNLLALRDSAELLLGPVVVEAGCYDKIRLEVSSVELVRGEESFEANLPANGKIDLNPRGPFCVVPGETLVLQLDLDAENSIHVVETGHGRKFNFRPVVFVTVVDGARDVLGKLVRLSGQVSQVGTDRFTMCATMAGPLARPIVADPVCTEVLLAEGVSLFDLDGTPFALSSDRPLESVVFDDDFVRAVGRYTVMADTGGATAARDELDRLLRRFLGEVVEVGVSPQSWGRYAGEILPGRSLNGDCAGTFEFRLDAGQGISRELDIAVHLYAGSRLFDRDGAALGCGDLPVGGRAVVDAVVSRSDTGRDVLNAATVVTRSEPQTRIDGVLSAVGEGGRLTILPDGAAPEDAVCTVLGPRTIPLLYTPGEADVPAEFREVDLGAVPLGGAVTVFGEWQAGEECFDAGTLLVTVPAAAPAI